MSEDAAAKPDRTGRWLAGILGAGCLSLLAIAMAAIATTAAAFAQGCDLETDPGSCDFEASDYEPDLLPD